MTRPGIPRLEARNVERIAALDLCHYCGTCVAACPKDNLVRLANSAQGYYFHVVDEIACGTCDLCLQVCPGEELDLRHLNTQVFGAPATNVELGHFQACYLAHASDPDARLRGASGGITTTLFGYCLDHGLLDGVIVAEDGAASLRAPRLLVARTRAELVASAGSKYYPLPLMEGLLQVLRAPGRYGIVGLPCHVHGLRKFEQLRRSLQAKIALQLGLFCGYSTDFASLDFLASRVGAAGMEAIARVGFRDGHWPGRIALELRDGSVHHLSRGERDIVAMIHMPTRCVTCPDQTAELADLAVGDAWLPEIVNRKDGQWSALVVVRTSRGREAFDAAVKAGWIEAREVSSEKVVEAQRNLLVYKKRGMRARLRVLAWLGKGTPRYGPEGAPYRSRLLDYVGAVLFAVVNAAAKQAAVRRLLCRLPSRVIAPFAYLFRHALQSYDLQARLRRKLGDLLP